MKFVGAQLQWIEETIASKVVPEVRVNFVSDSNVIQ